MPASCHPKTTSISIPFSLSLRIVRICTSPIKRDLRLQELKTLLMAREYPERIIDSAINKARKIPRKIALLKIRQKEKNDRPIFIIKYDPRLPTINSLTSKHWRSMVKQDKYLEEVFQEPPLTAYRRQRNLRDILIKAKVPPAPSLRPKRDLFGMSKCGKSCTTCPYVKEGKTVKVNNQ